MDVKPFWKSKTFYFNLLALIVAIATAFGYTSFTPDAKTGEYALVAVTLINLLLRFITSQPVGVTAKRK